MSRRWSPRLKDAAVVAGLLLLAAILAYIIGWIAEGSARMDALRTELTATQEDAQTLHEQVEDLGATPMVTPSPPGSGPTGPPGPIGPRGRPPTAAEVRGAVIAYCAERNGCRGPTQADVAAAVRAYCNDRGECRGPRGEAGVDGTDGQDGADAPPPSDEQVAAAVAAYCSERDECRGPRGEPGERGPRGSPGPACPPGYSREQAMVVTTDGPRDAVICVRDEESEEP